MGRELRGRLGPQGRTSQAPPPVTEEEEATAKAQAFESYWFSREAQPLALCLDLMLAVEEELGWYWWHLQQFEFNLAEEQFKLEEGCRTRGQMRRGGAQKEGIGWLQKGDRA